jgi:hypothetical protein
VRRAVVDAGLVMASQVRPRRRNSGRFDGHKCEFFRYERERSPPHLPRTHRLRPWPLRTGVRLLCRLLFRSLAQPFRAIDFLPLRNIFSVFRVTGQRQWPFSWESVEDKLRNHRYRAEDRHDRHSSYWVEKRVIMVTESITALRDPSCRFGERLRSVSDVPADIAAHPERRAQGHRLTGGMRHGRDIDGRAQSLHAASSPLRRPYVGRCSP